MTQLPDALLNKSLQTKQIFLAGYTAAVKKGLTEDESLFAGLAAVLT